MEHLKQVFFVIVAILAHRTAAGWDKNVPTVLGTEDINLEVNIPKKVFPSTKKQPYLKPTSVGMLNMKISVILNLV